MTTIRQLNVEEIDRSLELSQYAFQYTLTPDQLAEKRSQTKVEQIWGCFVDNQLAAKVVILPFQVHIQGVEMKMGGLASVSSWPEYRRQGMVGKLLVHSLQVMRDNGQILSYLNPFSFPFYRKYGWERFCDVKSYTLTTDQLPKFKTDGYVQRKSIDDVELIQSMYQRYASRFNGMLKRNREWWMETVFKNKMGHLAVYYHANDMPGGYLFYTVKDRTMRIHEMVHLDHQAFLGLWEFIGNHDSMIESLTFTAPADDQFPFFLQNPRVKQEIAPFFMTRIVDVAAFFTKYPFQPLAATGEYILHVEDPYAPWNDGTFTLSINKEGNASVTKLDSNVQTVEGIQCSIQTLSTMMIGFQRPDYLHEVGLLHGKKEDVQNWQRLIADRTPFLMDAF